MKAPNPEPADGLGNRARAQELALRAQGGLADLLQDAGWQIRSGGSADDRSVDLYAERGRLAYAIELKALGHGRSDRLVAAWAQAWLEIQSRAPSGYKPMGVVAAPRIARSAAEQVLRFAARTVPSAAVGVMDFVGLRRFRGEGLDGLDADPPPRGPLARSDARGVSNLFSDSNQWMLKVLLAPGIEERYLSAPRDRFRGAADLAKAAKVSVMSAFRLVQQLRAEGHLDESKGHLELVRRDALFERWRAAARKVREIPMRFRLRGMAPGGLRAVVSDHSACLALFAAADAHGIGLVRGVPPHVYLRKLEAMPEPFSQQLIPAANDPAEVIVRQAAAPRSVFRAAVRVDGQLVSDIIQVWLDVSLNPARGQEQADAIEHRIMGPLRRGNRRG